MSTVEKQEAEFNSLKTVKRTHMRLGGNPRNTRKNLIELLRENRLFKRLRYYDLLTPSKLTWESAASMMKNSFVGSEVKKFARWNLEWRFGAIHNSLVPAENERIVTSACNLTDTVSVCPDSSKSGIQWNRDASCKKTRWTPGIVSSHTEQSWSPGLDCQFSVAWPFVKQFW